MESKNRRCRRDGGPQTRPSWRDVRMWNEIEMVWNCFLRSPNHRVARLELVRVALNQHTLPRLMNEVGQLAPERRPKVLVLDQCELLLNASTTRHCFDNELLGDFFWVNRLHTIDIVQCPNTTNTTTTDAAKNSTLHLLELMTELLCLEQVALTDFDMSGRTCKSNIGQRLGQLLVGAGDAPSLTSLSLITCTLDGETARGLTNAVLNKAANSPLQRLHLECCNLDDDMFQTMGKFFPSLPFLTQLRLSQNQLSSKSVSVLTRLLPCLTDLQTLSLSANLALFSHASNDSMQAFCRQLRQHASLRSLDLRATGLGSEETWKSLLQSLEDNASLEHVDLWGNSPPNDSPLNMGKCLIQSLPRAVALRSLRLPASVALMPELQMAAEQSLSLMSVRLEPKFVLGCVPPQLIPSAVARRRNKLVNGLRKQLLLRPCNDTLADWPHLLQAVDQQTVLAGHTPLYFALRSTKPSEWIGGSNCG